MQKIMIVEDDEFIREELENIYEKAGYAVFCVTDFFRVLSFCEEEQPDLLVLDLGLPESVDLHCVRKFGKRGNFRF